MLLNFFLILFISSTSTCVFADHTDTFNEIQSLMDSAVESGLPGVSMAIADSQGVLWTGVSGWADIERKIPTEKDHLYGVGSITKTFVSTVILQLAEEGRLDLNATAQEVLGKSVTKGIANTDTATILQLLNHTAGVPTWEFDTAWIPVGRGSLMDPKKIWGKTETLNYLLDQDPAQNPPGERFNYSNTHHTLLGLIVEKVTGNDAAREIRRRIQSQIDTPNIYLDGFESFARDRMASGYHVASKKFQEVAGIHSSFAEVAPEFIKTGDASLSVEWTAGGMVATATDLSRYAQALASGRLLDKRSMATLLDFRPTGSPGVEVGHGVFRKLDDDTAPQIGHSGGVLGYSAKMNWFENGKIAWAILINQGHMHTGKDHSRTSVAAFTADPGLMELLWEINTRYAK